MSRALVIGMVCASLAWGCAADGDSAAGADIAGAICADALDCPEGFDCFDGACVFQGEGPDGEGASPGAPGGPGAPAPAPPELEEEIVPVSGPAAGREHVWVSSPTTDAVIRIAAADRTVVSIPVGDRPTVVRAVPGEDRLVVLNRGSDELTIIEHDPQARPPDQTRFIPLPGHFNALDLSPSGRFAFAWLDLAEAEPGEDLEGLQDVAVLDVSAGVVHPVSIGFRPQRVRFADGDLALFVTDDGLSVIEPGALDGPSIAPTIPVAPSVFAQAEREVRISLDGDRAVSRGPGEPGITVVALAEGIPRFIALGAEPTDLDLLPDGRTALVMMREARALALVPLDLAVEAPEQIRLIELPDLPLGSAVVSPAGDRALLYATRPDAPPVAALLDLDAETVRPVRLRKRARGAAIDPEGRVAYVLHGIDAPAPIVDSGDEDAAELGPADLGLADLGLADLGPADQDPEAPEPIGALAPGIDPELAEQHGWSLIDLQTGFVVVRPTPAEPFGLLFAPRDPVAFVLHAASPEAPAAVMRIDLDRFDARSWPLWSPPEVVGLLPAADRAFITQSHPTGRIGFLPLDAAEGRVETVTGYTLGGRIE